MKTRHGVNIVSAHAKDLEMNLKKGQAFQDRRKHVQTDSGLEIDFAIPFAPNFVSKNYPQSVQLGKISPYHRLQ